MQKMWGKQGEFLQNCDLFFGTDRWHWLCPTHPTLKINYLERMYTRTQMRQIVREGGSFEEEEWDLNKKHYIRELRRSNCEKRIFLALFILASFGWYFYIQPTLVKSYQVE